MSAPLATYRPHLPGLWRELGCLGVTLLPLAAAVPLAMVDGRRALAAVALAALMSPVALGTGSLLLRGAAWRVEVRRGGLSCHRLGKAPLDIRWRDLARVQVQGTGERWVGCTLTTRGGETVRLTRLLGGGQALAFLVHHGLEARRYPLAVEEAARWAWPAAWSTTPR